MRPAGTRKHHKRRSGAHHKRRNHNPMQPDRAGFSHLNGTRPRTSKLEAMNFLGLYYALNG
jgi:hypothetical protein